MAQRIEKRHRDLNHLSSNVAGKIQQTASNPQRMHLIYHRNNISSYTHNSPRRNIRSWYVQKAEYSNKIIKQAYSISIVFKKGLTLILGNNGEWTNGFTWRHSGCTCHHDCYWRQGTYDHLKQLAKISKCVNFKNHPYYKGQGISRMPKAARSLIMWALARVLSGFYCIRRRGWALARTLLDHA